MNHYDLIALLTEAFEQAGLDVYYSANITAPQKLAKTPALKELLGTIATPRDVLDMD